MQIKLDSIVALVFFCGCAQSQKAYTNFNCIDKSISREILISKIAPVWHANLHAIEIAAFAQYTISKAPLSEQRQDFITYSASVTQSFTKEEQYALDRACQAVYTLWGETYPWLFEHEWQAIKMENGYCGNFPHTHLDYQLLSEAFLQFLVKISAENASDHDYLLAGANIVLHEQIHVIQRKAPDAFSQFYQSEWRWTHIDTQLPEVLRQYAVCNPDAPNWDFAFEINGQYFVPWTSIRNRQYPSRPQMGTDFTAVMSPLTSDQQAILPETLPLTHPPLAQSMMPAWGLKRGGDHPHEIMAYAIADVILLETIDADNADLKDMATESQIQAIKTFMAGFNF